MSQMVSRDMIIGQLVCDQDLFSVLDLTRTPPLQGWTAPEFPGIKFEGQVSFYFEGLWEIEPFNVDIKK